MWWRYSQTTPQRCRISGTREARCLPRSTRWHSGFSGGRSRRSSPFFQFVPGRNNVVADALSRPNQVVGTEWTLHQEVFDSLHKCWPVMIDLFASSLNHRCGVYFASVSDPLAAGTDAMLQSWDDLQGYAFPPFSMLPQVLWKLGSSKGAVITLLAPLWPQRGRFPEPPLPLLERWGLLWQPHGPSVPSEVVRALSSCLKTVRQFARASGISSGAALRLGSARRSSLIVNYQSKWSTFRH